MDYYAKTDGTNEFFARRALYNCAAKLRRGDAFAARKFFNLAQACRRAGGLTEGTEARITALKNSFEAW